MLIFISVLALQILIVALGVFLGYKRGIGRGIVRLVELLVMGAVSLLLGRLIAEKLASKAFSAILPLLSGDILSLVEAIPELKLLLIGFVGALLVPLIFALLFAIFGLISQILLKKRSKALVKLVARKDEDMSRARNHWIGLGIGAVSAVLVALVLFSPVYTMLSFVGGLSDESIALVGGAAAPEEQTPADAEGSLSLRPTLLKRGGFDLETFLREMRDASGKLAPVLSLHLTGHDTPHGDHYDAVEEADVLINAIAAALSHTTSCEQNSAGSADVLTKVTHVAQTSLPLIAGHPFAKELVADTACAAGTYLKNGGEIAGISTHTGDLMTDLLLDAMAQAFSETTVENLSDTTKTLFGVDLNAIEEEAKTAKPAETKKPAETSKAPSQSGENNTKPAETGTPEADGTQTPSVPAESQGSSKPAVTPVTTEQGALALLSGLDFNNIEALLADDAQCTNLITAVYLLDANPVFAPVIVKFCDSVPVILPNVTSAVAQELYTALVGGLFAEANYLTARGLQARAQDVKKVILDTAFLFDFSVSDNQAELGAICVVTRFFTQENIADPLGVSFEEFRNYLGVAE